MCVQEVAIDYWLHGLVGGGSRDDAAVQCTGRAGGSNTSIQYNYPPGVRVRTYTRSYSLYWILEYVQCMGNYSTSACVYSSAGTSTSYIYMLTSCSTIKCWMYCKYTVMSGTGWSPLYWEYILGSSTRTATVAHCTGYIWMSGTGTASTALGMSISPLLVLEQISLSWIGQNVGYRLQLFSLLDRSDDD